MKSNCSPVLALACLGAAVLVAVLIITVDPTATRPQNSSVQQGRTSQASPPTRLAELKARRSLEAKNRQMERQSEILEKLDQQRQWDQLFGNLVDEGGMK